MGASCGEIQVVVKVNIEFTQLFVPQMYSPTGCYCDPDPGVLKLSLDRLGISGQSIHAEIGSCSVHTGPVWKWFGISALSAVAVYPIYQA